MFNPNRKRKVSSGLVEAEVLATDARLEKSKKRHILKTLWRRLRHVVSFPATEAVLIAPSLRLRSHTLQLVLGLAVAAFLVSSRVASQFKSPAPSQGSYLEHPEASLGSTSGTTDAASGALEGDGEERHPLEDASTLQEGEFSALELSSSLTRPQASHLDLTDDTPSPKHKNQTSTPSKGLGVAHKPVRRTQKKGTDGPPASHPT